MRFLGIFIVIFYSLSVFGMTAAQRLLSTVPATSSFIVGHSFSWPANNNTVFVRATAINSAQALASAFTWNAWVKDASQSQAIIWMKGDGFNSCASNGYIANAGGLIRVQFSGSQDLGTAFDGAWHMATVVYSGTTITYYVDGVSIGTKTGTAGADCTGKPVQIGAYSNPGNVTDGFIGKLAQISLWNVAMSGAEVAALASGGHPANLANHTQVAHLKTWYYLGDGDATGAGNVKDYSGNSYNATITGAITIDTDHP